MCAMAEADGEFRGDVAFESGRDRFVDNIGISGDAESIGLEGYVIKRALVDGICGSRAVEFMWGMEEEVGDRLFVSGFAVACGGAGVV